MLPPREHHHFASPFTSPGGPPVSEATLSDHWLPLAVSPCASSDCQPVRISNLPAKWRQLASSLALSGFQAVSAASLLSRCEHLRLACYHHQLPSSADNLSPGCCLRWLPECYQRLITILVPPHCYRRAEERWSAGMFAFLVTRRLHQTIARQLPPSRALR